VCQASPMGYSLEGAVPAELLQHLRTLRQVLAVVLKGSAGPPEKHTNCIGVVDLCNLHCHKQRKSHTLQIVHASGNMHIIKITCNTHFSQLMWGALLGVDKSPAGVAPT
jgi:hypothetical protein